MQVPFLDLRAQYRSIRADVEACLADVCERQEFVLGREVEAFEAEIGRYVRCPQAIGVASGTDALTLALLALDVGPGDEVLTPAFTFVATAEAVALRGATPVFVDIDADTFNADPRSVAAQWTPRTRAVIAVDLFGQCADMTAILEIAHDRQGIVIEDAAQSIGAEHQGRRAGELAEITTFSFYPSKNLGGFGDGGLITALDPERAALLRQLRVHGESSRYVHERIGTNSRLDALQAAVLRVKLRHLDAWTTARQAHAQRYRGLFEAAGLLDRVRLPVASPSSTRHVYNQFTVRVQERDALRAHLAARDVGTAVYYPIPLHHQRCFAHLAAVSLPETERAAQEVLSLPLYPEMTTSQLEYVVDSIAAFAAGH